MATASEPMPEQVLYKPTTLRDRVRDLQASIENSSGIMAKNGPRDNKFGDQMDSVTSSISCKRGDPNYGRPIKGSKTEARGIKAHEHMCQETNELCYIIRQYGRENKAGEHLITFGELFQIYVVISDKLVGLLLRGRKHGLLTFDGEMLFQRRDDNVVITLFKAKPKAVVEDVNNNVA